MNRALSILLLIAVASLPASSAAAQSGVVPELVNYQGLLADISGTPFASGTYVLEVRVWDAASGGTLLWGPQVFDRTMSDPPVVGHSLRVPVSVGRFNVMLGPEDVDGDPLAGAFSSANVFIELSVPESGGAISPRQRLLATPFALSAESLGGRVTVDGAAGEAHVEGDLVVQSAGEVLLATDDASQLVTVDGDLTVTGDVQGDLNVTGDVLASNLVGTGGQGMGLIIRQGVEVVTFSVPGTGDRSRSVNVDFDASGLTEVLNIFVTAGSCSRTSNLNGTVAECGGDYRRVWTRDSGADALDGRFRLQAGIEDTGWGPLGPPLDSWVRDFEVHWMVIGR